ncbi:glucose-6-phosphate 1-dehydrogenase [Scaptodrosophila lebanonensis]|uniref:Glucose-6-phosphate 1-dehydrogenase n=1 Tax=Drosophila lebanonensis TaxID=7225 RepID=A0A6J2UGU4_DROLE|nr:glucose-6-phosphate 1-dehydrogenase [Scaptodrosophila lebanonensis]
MQPLDLQNETAHSFVVFGASGKLAKRKIFPALWALYRDNRLPQFTQIYTFSRTMMHTSEFRIWCVPYMHLDRDRDPKKYNSFWTNVHCVQGQYDQTQDYITLNETMSAYETKHNMTLANRVFYLALPPIVFDAVTLNISRKCVSNTGWNRIVVEKPFARNDITFKPYQTQLCQCFKESQIYMIDHYLGKQMVQDMMALRFSNCLWGDTWDNRHIAAIMISVKCDKPVVARPDYFDSYGIIRDVMTNHMMQLLALIAMEPPYTGDVEGVREEKLKVLKDVVSPDLSDVIVGQYVNNGRESDLFKVGYLEHHYIPKNSITPTYAMVVLRINNKRWSGVPFILRAGKALNESKVEVRVQYKAMECEILEGMETKRNELVMCLAPKEHVFMRVMLKKPGEKLCLQESNLNLTLRDPRICVPQNFHSLLLDVLEGSQMLFMRSDEQCEIWRIFSPLLSALEADRIKPIPYALGSWGPMAAYRKAVKHGFLFYHSAEAHEGRQSLTPQL